MKIAYKNLTFDFIYSETEEDTGAGYTSLEVYGDSFKKFLEHLGWTSIEYVPDQFSHDEDIENFITAMNESEDLDKAITIYNADLMILFFHWAISKTDTITLTYYGENPMWLLHDLIHTKNDCDGYEVTVDSFREERAVFESMDLAKELNLLSCFTVNIFRAFNTEFEARFKQSFPMYNAIKYLNQLSN